MIFNPWDVFIRWFTGQSENLVDAALDTVNDSSVGQAISTLSGSTPSDYGDFFGIGTQIQSGKQAGEDNLEVAQPVIDATDPTSSAANVINYDPNKSALDNMYGYAMDNNSASAYSSFLENKHAQELSDTAIARAIADAESQGISKYQLFQAGNMAASTPSSAGSLWNSYEKAMDRRESMSEKEIAAFTAIIVAAINSAGKILSFK